MNQGILQSCGQSRFYESAAVQMVAGVNIFELPFGMPPVAVRAVGICRTFQSTYLPGDEVDVAAMAESGVNAHYTWAAGKIYITIPNIPTLMGRDTPSSFLMGIAGWSLKVYCIFPPLT